MCLWVHNHRTAIRGGIKNEETISKVNTDIILSAVYQIINNLNKKTLSLNIYCAALGNCTSNGNALVENIGVFLCTCTQVLLNWTVSLWPAHRHSSKMFLFFSGLWFVIVYKSDSMCVPVHVGPRIACVCMHTWMCIAGVNGVSTEGIASLSSRALLMATGD